MNEEQYWLPEDFVRRMEELLGAEWAAFRDSYEKERAQGLRINPLKTAGEEARAAASLAWMQETWQHILSGLCSVLKRDPKVQPDAFTEQFTVEKFADVLFSLMLSALLRQDYDPNPVLEIVRRTLY